MVACGYEDRTKALIGMDLMKIAVFLQIAPSISRRLFSRNRGLVSNKNKLTIYV